MKKSKLFRLTVTASLIFLFVSLTAFQSSRPLIGWGDWVCSEETNEGLCWKNCHRTYYFFINVQSQSWSGPCWQNPSSGE